jgi:hypothetical protein
MKRFTKSPSPPRKKNKKVDDAFELDSSKDIKFSMEERALVNLSECIMDTKASKSSNELLFTPLGKKTAISLYPLTKTWGYRTGPDEEHEAYEKDTHGYGQPGGFAKNAVQEFTDMLFRNIDEIYYSKFLMNLRSSDTLYKLNSAIDMFSFGGDDGPLNKNFKNWAQDLIKTYLNEKKIKELFSMLAYECSLNLGPAYTFLSGVALALVFISIGEWDNAKTTYILLKKMFV